jgi:4-hydroxy-3-polyprenylbenzoate decarboxylase
VPADADIVIEGWIDPSEDPVWEGPFGDHTGFYSLADWYPVFRVSCITHRKDAVYPATIVGIPPQEDAWLTKASEKIFLAPLKFAIQPEIEDFHMPDAGVAHNLAIVKIRKTYPGQGKKVISALLGAGQMMFTKYLAVVSGDVDIRNYTQLLGHVLDNTVFRRDLLFSQGPLDVLDHASDLPLLGGKLGIDATVKTGEELTTDPSDEFLSQYNIPDGKGNNRQANAGNSSGSSPQVSYQHIRDEVLRKCRNACSSFALLEGYPVLVAGTGQYDDPDALKKLKEVFSEPDMKSVFRLVLVVDDRLDVKDWFTIVWQMLGNTDPGRDIIFLSDNSILADGTAKIFGKRAFKRKWPNIVCSSESTIRSVDMKWDKLGLGPFIHSPSEKNSGMNFGEGAEVNPREITKGGKDKE